MKQHDTALQREPPIRNALPLDLIGVPTAQHLEIGLVLHNRVPRCSLLERFSRIRELRRHLHAVTPNVTEDGASLKVKDVTDRQVLWSPTLQCHVRISRGPNGGARGYVRVPGPDIESRLRLMLRTLAAARTLSTAGEQRARNALRRELTPYQWQQYDLAGTFIERSKASGLIYVFRRLMPTIALRFDETKLVLGIALCMHPLGHAANSHTGVLPPSDEVLAHVLLMRSDEHRYWRRSTQHRLDRPEAAI